MGKLVTRYCTNNWQTRGIYTLNGLVSEWGYLTPATGHWRGVMHGWHFATMDEAKSRVRKMAEKRLILLDRQKVRIQQILVGL